MFHAIKTAMLCLVLGVVAGCATSHSQVSKISDWKAGWIADGIDPVSTVVQRGALHYVLTLYCNPVEGADRSALQLVVEERNSEHQTRQIWLEKQKTSELKFDDGTVVPIRWSSQQEGHRLLSGPLDIGKPLARAFREQSAIELTGLYRSGPIHFTIGKGPYQPPIPAFLASCPVTKPLLPRLSRIVASDWASVTDAEIKAKFEQVQKTNPLPSFAPGPLVRRRGTAHIVSAVTPDGTVLWPVITRSSGIPSIDRRLLQWFNTVKLEGFTGLNSHQLVWIEADMR